MELANYSLEAAASTPWAGPWFYLAVVALVLWAFLRFCEMATRAADRKAFAERLFPRDQGLTPEEWAAMREEFLRKVAEERAKE